MSHDSFYSVLLVEDNTGFGNLLSEMFGVFADSKFFMHRCDGVTKAIEYASNHPVDIVLLDWSLPASDGFEILQQLRNQLAHIPILVLTNEEKSDAGIQALRLGAQDYLPKGRVSLDVLTRVLTYTVERFSPQRKLQAILDAAVEGIVIIDQDSKIEMANPSVEQVFGYTPEELIGKDIRQLVPMPHQTKHDSYVHRYIETNEPHIIGKGRECIGLHKNGTVFPLYLSVADASVRNHRFFVGIVRDISKEKEAARLLKEQKEALEQSNAELEEFAHVVSHDLRSPLSVLHGSLQLFRVQYKQVITDKSNEILSNAIRTAERMNQMIGDLLDYASLHKTSTVQAVSPLSTILSDSKENVRALMEKHNATLQIESMPDLKLPGTQTTRLFQNLLSNAIKFHGEDPPYIEIFAKEEKEFWVISVKDNGVGIEEKYIPELFGMFHRFHEDHGYEGTGIGLAACKKIVERVLGGTIWASSELGVGTIFSFTIPKTMN